MKLVAHLGEHDLIDLHWNCAEGENANIWLIAETTTAYCSMIGPVDWLYLAGFNDQLLVRAIICFVEEQIYT